jgi:hypothetical protein
LEPRAQNIKAGFDLAHMMFSSVTADLTQAAIDKALPGATITAAAPIIAHAILTEDRMLTQVFGTEMVLETGGFAARTGIATEGNVISQWIAGKYDLAAMIDYAQAVFANTTKLLEGATVAQLDGIVQGFIGPSQGSDYLAGLAVVHFSSHIGEVAALKGAQGLKGLPF